MRAFTICPSTIGLPFDFSFRFIDPQTEDCVRIGIQGRLRRDQFMDVVAMLARKLNLTGFFQVEVTERSKLPDCGDLHDMGVDAMNILCKSGAVKQQWEQLPF